MRQLIRAIVSFARGPVQLEARCLGWRLVGEHASATSYTSGHEASMAYQDTLARTESSAIRADAILYVRWANKAMQLILGY